MLHVCQTVSMATVNCNSHTNIVFLSHDCMVCVHSISDAAHLTGRVRDTVPMKFIHSFRIYIVLVQSIS